MSDLFLYYVIKLDSEAFRHFISLGNIKDYIYHNDPFTKPVFYPTENVFLYLSYKTKRIVYSRIYVGYPIVSINNIVKLILKS